MNGFRLVSVSPLTGPQYVPIGASLEEIFDPCFDQCNLGTLRAGIVAAGTTGQLTYIHDTTGLREGGFYYLKAVLGMFDAAAGVSVVYEVDALRTGAGGAREPIGYLQASNGSNLAEFECIIQIPAGRGFRIDFQNLSGQGAGSTTLPGYYLKRLFR